MSFPDLLAVLMSLRGSNVATVKDMVDVRKYVSEEFDTLKDDVSDLKRVLSSLKP